MKEKYFQQPSVSGAASRFRAAPSADIERSTFDRSHAHKTTFDAGYLVPIYVDEVLPGDSFSLKETMFARLATPLKPVMDNMYLETFYFYVPYRLVWDNWERFCGARTDYTDDPSGLRVPQAVWGFSTAVHNNWAQYMGIPLGNQSAGNVSVNALPFRAYNLIYNDWFRDESVCTRLEVFTDDGPDDYSLQAFPWRRGKRHDYFTSCLPWPQLGDPVLIPVGLLDVTADTPAASAASFKPSTASAIGPLLISPTGAVSHAGRPVANDTLVWQDPKLHAAATAAGATINDLRTAFQIQRMLERDARGGTRYIEIVLSHFGVRSDDARLSRPEYLGGGSTRVNISPVPATSHDTAGEVAQGDLAGFGTAVNRGGFSKSFTEHGVIIGLANVRADINYQQGLERMWRRKTRYDFYWPTLAHLGEQAVLNSEIFCVGSNNQAQDDGVFGYQERYAEYRYKPSRISGKFLSSDPTSLDVWHLALDFATLPLLNQSFMFDNPPIARIVAVPNEPQFLVDIWFSLKCSRPMPVYGVPGYVDHF